MKVRSLLFVVPAIVVACGSDPKTPTPPGLADAAASEPEVTPKAPTPTADAAAPVPEATAAVSTPTPPADPSSPSDDCTPVGVALEKTVRPKLRDCYREGKKKEADLKGTVKITVVVDGAGKVKSIKIVEKTLPEAVAQCMLKAVKTTPFPEAAKCADKNITIPITFPTPN